MFNEQIRVIAEVDDLIAGRMKRAIIRGEMKDNHGQPLSKLSSQQIHVCLRLRKLGKAGLAELADELGVTPPAMSVMVNRLVEKGILCRTRSQTDRRKVEISISPSAKANIEAGDRVIKSVIVEIAEKIGPEALEHWYAAMKRIKEVFEEQGW